MPVNVNQLFQSIVKAGISDIHFKANTPPMIRLNGHLQSSGFSQMTPKHISELASVLMNDEQKERFTRDRELDYSYSVPNLCRFRVNAYMQKGSVALTLRVIPLEVRSFSELNLPSDTLKKIAANTRGLILIAGITGSGKTTTLNAILDYLNNHYSYNIITVEDPIEYFHSDIKSSISQREVGYDTESFGKALRHILRQDPDVVVLGEMRDAESIRAGMIAAETGHLVLATIHTMDATQTIDRIIESYEGIEQNSVRVRLGNVIKGVVAQRLLESTDGRNRYPATEVLIGTSLIRKLLVEGKSEEIHKAIEQGLYYNMHTFDQDILKLYQEKKITLEEALDAASNPDDLTLQLRGVDNLSV